MTSEHEIGFNYKLNRKRKFLEFTDQPDILYFRLTNLQKKFFQLKYIVGRRGVVHLQKGVREVDGVPGVNLATLSLKIWYKCFFLKL